MKRLLQKYSAKNFYINRLLYDIYFKKNSDVVVALIDKVRTDDYFVDIANLKRFTNYIKEKGVRYLARNVNFDNVNIYGIWDAIYGYYVKDKYRYISPAIEHGLILHNEAYRDVRNTARGSISTLGNFRKYIIQRDVKIPVFCLGSYINYANSFYSKDKLTSLKKELGKVLFVFPTHSTDSSEISINQELFINRVREYSRDFDTVLVNAFWWNINDKLIERLYAEGYKVVSCGFGEDVNFLKRLKSYFTLSDLCIGDSVGTHIGYSVACNVPYTYIPMGTKTKLLLEWENKDIDFVEMHQNKIAEAFFNSTEITDKQREIVNYYWGNNLFKTEDEIKAIVEINKEILDMTYGFTDFRWSAAQKLLKKYADTDEMKYKLLKDAL